MPTPIAICIEDLHPASPASRYLRCVAIPGRQPGLGLRADGVVVWKDGCGLACELWVSADERLIAYRPDGAPPLVVRRAGRSLDAPVGKPVVLLDQDELRVGEREVRIHLHGATPRVHGPSPLPARSGMAARITAVAAAAVVLTAAAGCNKDKPRGGADGPIEVREMPPAPPLMPMPEAMPDSAPDPGDAGPGALDGGDAEEADAEAVREAAAGDGSAKKNPSASPPIEVRDHPPAPFD